MERAKVSSSLWADLPQELLSSIVEHLNNNRLRILRFRAVCRSWRAACPLPSSLFPFKLDSPRSLYYIPRSVNSDRFFTVSTVYLIESLNSKIIDKPNCWLVMLDELNPGKMCIRYPLSKIKVSDDSEEFPKELNLLDFRVTEIANSYTLSEVIYPDGDFNRLELTFDYWNMEIEKVLLLPLIGNNFDKNGLCFLVLNQGGYLEVFSIGSGEQTFVHRGNFYGFYDIVYFKKSIYAVDYRARVFPFDYNSFEMTKVSSGVGAGTGTRKRLVLSSDHNDLYLLIQSSELNGFCYINPYRLNEEKGEWEKVSSLNGQVFFVGADCAFSFLARTYPSLGFQQNCIFASRHSFRPCQGRYSFDMLDYMNRDKTKNMTGMFKVKDGGHYEDMESCDMFWPHSNWVASNTFVSKSSV